MAAFHLLFPQSKMIRTAINSLSVDLFIADVGGFLFVSATKSVINDDVVSKATFRIIEAIRSKLEIDDVLVFRNRFLFILPSPKVHGRKRRRHRFRFHPFLSVHSVNRSTYLVRF